MENNYYPKKKNTGEIEIPDFLTKEPDIPMINLDEEDFDYTDEMVKGINNALEQGKIQNTKETNMFHLKELDKVADAYTEEEARVIVKRLVSNYPELVLGEVADLIRDMQELSGAILKNSKIFATKRGEV